MKNVCKRCLWALSLLPLLLCLAGALQPGARIRLTQRGLNYAAEKAVDAIKIQGRTFDDLSGREGRTEYSFTGMSVRSFSKPSTSVTVSQSRGMTMSATGARITVGGNWRYKYSWWYVRIRDHGSFTATASGVNFQVTVRIGNTTGGQPTITPTGCSASIGGLRIRLGGSWLSFIYNLLVRLFDGQLKRKLSSLLCDKAMDAINNDLKDQLRQTSVVTTVGNVMTLDYGLTQGVVFADGHMDALLKGKFSWKASPSPLPVQNAVIPPSSEASRMVHIWGSDYVINSFIYTAYHNNLLTYTTSLGPNSGSPISSSARITLQATQLPYVRTTPAFISVMMTGNVTITQNSTNVLVLEVILEAKINASLSGTTLKASVTSLIPRIQVLEPTEGPIQESMLTQIVQQATDTVILPQLNELGDKGIDIPSVQGWSFVNPTLKQIRGNLMISTDLAWTI